MRNTLLFLLFFPVLLGGCITNNYTCKCGKGCCIPDKETAVASEPVVSPDEIGNIEQDQGSPAFPEIKPWYVPD